MAINQLNTNNTFSEWVSTTSYLVAVANNLTDGINANPFIANTNMVFKGDQASLNVNNSAEINRLYANTANIANASVSGNSYFGNVAITGTFTGAPNTAIYSSITAAIDSSIAFAIALGG
jgi:hypothetical protein